MASSESIVGTRPIVVRREPSLNEKARKVFRRPQFWFGLVVLVPTMIWYWFFAYFPILRGLWLAVVDYDFVTRTFKGFIGLQNFETLLMDPLVFTAFTNTVVLGVLEFSITLPLAIFVAAMLVSVKRGRNVYQGFIFLPVVVSLVAISLLFLMMTDPDTGQLNQLLRGIGLPESKWLSSPDSALMTVAVINVWKGLGFAVLLLAAGMLNIPSEVHDAAKVDGASSWQQFWQITIPLTAPIILLLVVLMSIGALQEYTSVVVLTKGGPGTATYVVNLLIVEQAFSNMRFGVAAAAAFIEFVVIFLISILEIKFLRPNWSY
jgi:ABC-type sugar transport system permease subunit